MNRADHPAETVTMLVMGSRSAHSYGLSVVLLVTRSMFVIWNLRRVSTRKYTTRSLRSTRWPRILKPGKLPLGRVGMRIQAIPRSRTKVAVVMAERTKPLILVLAV
jgi:hypothetical protein